MAASEALAASEAAAASEALAASEAADKLKQETLDKFDTASEAAIHEIKANALMKETEEKSADEAAAAKDKEEQVAEKGEDGKKAPVNANKAAMLNAYEKAFHSL